jgi:hypothetical protein
VRERAKGRRLPEGRLLAEPIALAVEEARDWTRVMLDRTSSTFACCFMRFVPSPGEDPGASG